MQIKPAPVSCYRKPRIDETDHPEAPRRQAILAKVDAFRTRGMSLEVALFAAKVPRSTYYRWRCALRRDGGTRPGAAQPATGRTGAGRSPVRVPGEQATQGVQSRLSGWQATRRARVLEGHGPQRQTLGFGLH